MRILTILIIVVAGCSEGPIEHLMHPPDAGMQDTQSTDGVMEDQGSDDTTKNDGKVSWDGAGSDTLSPDSEQKSDSKAVQQDTQPSTDTFVQPDTQAPDMIQPDMIQPDTMSPDSTAPKPDTMPAGCTHPPVKKVCTGGWCYIPAGCFTMGSPASEPCRNKISKETQHQVWLTHPFWISETEVTHKAFITLMGWDPKKTGPVGTGYMRPVGRINWHHAADYCNQLSVKEKRPTCYTCTASKTKLAKCVIKSTYGCKGYRLPTEAEWEYAYRAGTTTAYYNGKNDPSKCLTCTSKDANADKIGRYCANWKTSSPWVAQKLPNAWGLYDMAGHVAEFTQDDFKDDLGSAKQVNPLTISGAIYKVMRGGRYLRPAADLRAAMRDKHWTDGSAVHWGFRCVRGT